MSFIRKYKLYLLGIKTDNYYEDIFGKLDYLFKKSFSKVVGERTYIYINVGSFNYEYAEISDNFLHFSKKFYDSVFGEDFKNDNFILYYFNNKYDTKCSILNISFISDMSFLFKNNLKL